MPWKVTLDERRVVATIAVIFGSITGLLATAIAVIMGASHSTVALVWLTGSLWGLVSFITAGWLCRGRCGNAGDVIAEDLRALRQMRSVWQK